MAIIEKLAMIARHRLLNGLSNGQEAYCFLNQWNRMEVISLLMCRTLC